MTSAVVVLLLVVMVLGLFDAVAVLEDVALFAGGRDDLLFFFGRSGGEGLVGAVGRANRISCHDAEVVDGAWGEAGEVGGRLVEASSEPIEGLSGVAWP